MIELTRKQLRLFRNTLRQALNITSARRAPVVTLRAADTELRIQAVTDTIAVEQRVSGEFSTEVIVLPYAALVAGEGRQQEPVTITQRESTVTLHWLDAGIPQQAQYATGDAAAFPASPAESTPLDRSFIRAMADAVDTTDTGSGRYALNCVRLRGADGQIAATDGRQALIQCGFRFPWDDTLLVPATRAFSTPAFASTTDVTIGRTEDQVTVCAGDWTLQLQIEQAGRFPAVEDLIPPVAAAATTISLSDADAEFLQQATKRLPAAQECNAPVTVDLNGTVAIRARAVDQDIATELILRGSQRSGKELRFNTNREFLARAVQLGFRQIYLRSAEVPACCRDNQRSFVWGLLEQEGTVPPDTNATRIESPIPTAATPARTGNQQPQRKVTIPVQNPQRATPAGDTKPDTERPENILGKAEALRDSLIRALTDTRELIAVIKARRKQNRLVASTLRSLKQLEDISA